MKKKRGKISSMKKIYSNSFLDPVYRVKYEVFLKYKQEDVVAAIEKSFNIRIEVSPEAMGWTLFDGASKTVFIWCDDNKFNARNVAILAHECIHAKNEVFDYHGLTRKEGENDEAEAYYFDYILGTCVKLLKGQK